MALTYRTGSDGKGSALTIEELDNNFRHFTGSHTVSGSVTVSGSILISGSIIPDGAGVHSLGNADNYFSELYLSNDSLVFISGSVSSSFSVDPSGSLSGSFDTQFNSGSCLIGCTSSVVPSYTAQEGTFVFVATGSDHFIYAYVGGGWKSGSLA
mgnify:CR=1 FL=1